MGGVGVQGEEERRRGGAQRQRRAARQNRRGPRARARDRVQLAVLVDAGERERCVRDLDRLVDREANLLPAARAADELRVEREALALVDVREGHHRLRGMREARGEREPVEQVVEHGDGKNVLGFLIDALQLHRECLKERAEHRVGLGLGAEAARHGGLELAPHLRGEIGGGARAAAQNGRAPGGARVSSLARRHASPSLARWAWDSRGRSTTCLSSRAGGRCFPAPEVPRTPVD